MYKKLLMSVICLSFLASVFFNPDISLSDGVLQENVDLQTQKTEFSENVLNDLMSKRDKLLEENLSLHNIDAEIRENLKYYTFNDEKGLIKYIDNKFPNISEIKKLEMQNKVLNYLNKNNTTVDSEPLFIECIFKEAELSFFLMNEKSDDDLSKKDNLIELVKKEEKVFQNSNFENREELASYISALINTNLTKEEIRYLIENDFASSYIKHELIFISKRL